LKIYPTQITLAAEQNHHPPPHPQLLTFPNKHQLQTQTGFSPNRFEKPQTEILSVTKSNHHHFNSSTSQHPSSIHPHNTSTPQIAINFTKSPHPHNIT
jgi:hypothetical protein